MSSHNGILKIILQFEKPVKYDLCTAVILLLTCLGCEGWVLAWFQVKPLRDGASLGAGQEGETDRDVQIVRVKRCWLMMVGKAQRRHLRKWDNQRVLSWREICNFLMQNIFQLPVNINLINRLRHAFQLLVNPLSIYYLFRLLILQIYLSSL